MKRCYARVVYSFILLHSVLEKVFCVSDYYFLCKKLNLLTHKAGFVNIIGYPNTGKSTLLNEMLGEKLSIVTSKAQTTRHRILGMLNGEDYQIIFSDTPGILEPKYKLQESMMQTVTSTFTDADHLLLMIDLSRPKEFSGDILNKVVHLQKRITVLLNKLDLVTQEEASIQYDFWHNLLPDSDIFVISSLHKHGIKELLDHIISRLPESPPYYPKDQLTDKSERFIVSEMIRKQIFQHTSQEIPYSSEIVVNSFKEDEDIIRMGCNIFVERDSQKNIIIGAGGKMIKKIGTEARMEIEAFFGKQVYIDLFVKVDKDWRSREDKLKKYGYIN